MHRRDFLKALTAIGTALAAPKIATVEAAVSISEPPATIQAAADIPLYPIRCRVEFIKPHLTVKADIEGLQPRPGPEPITFDQVLYGKTDPVPEHLRDVDLTMHCAFSQEEIAKLPQLMPNVEPMGLMDEYHMRVAIRYGEQEIEYDEVLFTAYDCMSVPKKGDEEQTWKARLEMRVPYYGRPENRAPMYGAMTGPLT